MVSVRSLPFVRRAFLAGAAFLLSTLAPALVMAQQPMVAQQPLVAQQNAEPAARHDAVAALRPVAQVNRVMASADFASRATLAHHVPAWVHNAALTTRAVDLTQTLHLSVIVRRDDTVQAAFEQLLADQQNPASPLYHQWLTPQQVGALYGPTESDLNAIQTWLSSEGLCVDSVQPNRVLIEVSGPAAKVASAFRTQFGYYALNGQVRLSAATDPSIPSALLPVIRGVGGLTEVQHRPTSHAHAAVAPLEHTAGGVRPNLTLSDGTHYITPGDFNLIYDVNSVLSGGNTGATIGSTPQRIAIIGRSRVVTADITNYETATGVTAPVPGVVLAGVDPGVATNGNADEATLDVDRVISVAPGAATELVIAKSSAGQDGVYIASAYNVNTRLDPIMTLSFGDCESDAGSADSNLYTNLFMAAAAEGISTFVSSGDSGADGCFSAGAAPVAGTPSANDLCNAYVTCVGGTEFVEGNGNYWSSSNSSGYNSVLSYIPEGAWNEPSYIDSNSAVVWEMASSGGGPSVFVSRPSWQTGSGVPSGSFRETPDISFTSAEHDGYFACFAAGNGSCVRTSTGLPFTVFSGTSAAAPSMAGIAALLNTKLGQAQGLLNPLLYKLAASSTAAGAFHDVTTATSGVSGCTTSTASVCNNSTPTQGSNAASVIGFSVGTGFDDVTGLGSLDVAKFLTAAVSVSTPTSLALTAAPSPASTNSNVTLTATLTPSTTVATAPSGTVTFYANGVQIGSAATLTANVATLSYAFATAGTYAITAVYSGDSNYATSTATAVSLVVSSAFTITPVTTTFGVSTTVVSGATLTDTISLASLAPFVGNVALSCAVSTPLSTDTAAGTCSLAPTSVALASAGTGAATLTIHTTVGTSGTLNVVVTGASGTNSTSATVAVKLTAPSFTVANPTPATLTVLGGATSGNISTLTVTSVNGFAGSVNLTCTATNAGVGSSSTGFSGTCAATPVTLTAGGTATTTVSVTTTAASYGSLNLVVAGTGTTAGATLAAGSSCGTSTQPCISVTVPQPFTLSNPGSLAFTSGATTGNSENISVVAATGFVGAVNLTCAITTSLAAYQPSCAVAPLSVSLTSGSTATAVVSIGSHVAVTQAGVSGVQFAATWLGAGFASLLGAFALRRRRALRSLALLVLLVCGLGAISGCGSNTTPKTTTSSSGSYTVTVTGASGSSSTTTSFNVTIQ